MAQNFHQRFNIEVSLVVARRSFVNRINNFIFANLLKDMYKNRGLNPASRFEEYLCSKLGERWNGWGCSQQVLWTTTIYTSVRSKLYLKILKPKT